VADLAGELQDERLRDLAPATLLYQRLSPADAFDLVGLARLGDAQALPEVRERSAEALGALADPSMIPSLHAALHDGDLRLRRSAALALGSFRGGALLDVLARQLAAEQDELLRGYLLLAIANQQAAPAAALLTDTLARGDALVRPWAALALGLLARREADVSQPARATLRLEAARSHAVTDRLAFALAGGLARDEARAEDFAQMLADSADAHVRLVAAEALTLLGAGARDGWPGSVELRLALKAQLADEADPGARGVLAEALAVHRDARDVSALLAALCAVHAGEPVADLARGCGAHRTRDMLSGLSALVADVSLKAPVRAAAWQSLGLLLDPQWSSRLPGALAGAQLDALPDWCSRLLDQSTL